jgi:recombinational DNA repair protein (RecF pathway)
MSHTIYTTEGFILKSVNFGEANKYFFIFTKEFGLIRAAAQSVRHLKSKLRYGLEDLSLSQISVVRGREVWRLTSAEKKLGLAEKERLLMWSQIFSLLLRLLHGEEKNDALFSILKEGMFFLNTLDDVGGEKKQKERAGLLASFECIIALRILSVLGYIGQIGDFDQFTLSPYFTPELILNMSALRSRAIGEINKSLKETHL